MRSAMAKLFNLYTHSPPIKMTVVLCFLATIQPYIIILYVSIYFMFISIFNFHFFFFKPSFCAEIYNNT